MSRRLRNVYRIHQKQFMSSALNACETTKALCSNIRTFMRLNILRLTVSKTRAERWSIKLRSRMQCVISMTRYDDVDTDLPEQILAIPDTAMQRKRVATVLYLETHFDSEEYETCIFGP